MRRILPFLLFGMALLPAHAAPEGQEQQAARKPQYSFAEALEDQQKRNLLLNELYGRLKLSPSEEDAKRVASTIEALSQKTGNEASDVFMQWGEETLAGGNMAQAYDYFDGAVMLSPNAAEAYFKRATISFAQGDFTHALADLQRALALEPRHTGVLMGLGAVFSDLGRDREALSAYARALEINPYLEDAKKLVPQLRKKVEGEGI